MFDALTCGPWVFRDTVNHSKSVINNFMINSMIKNDKKNEIKDLYSNFRCENRPSKHSDF